MADAAVLVAVLAAVLCVVASAAVVWYIARGDKRLEAARDKVHRKAKRRQR